MSLSKTIASSLIYRILNLATVFALTILLARILKADGFGIFSLLVANVTLFNLLSGLGIESGIIFQTAAGKVQQPVILSIIFWVLLFQLIVLAITEAGFNYFTGHYWLYNPALYAGILYFICISLIDKFTALYNGHHYYTRINRLLFISNMVILLVFAGCYFYGLSLSSNNYIQLFIGLTFLQLLLIGLLFFIYSGQKLRFAKVNARAFKLFFTYSAITFITNLIQFLAYRIDYWLMDYYHNKTQLGIYVLAVKLSQLYWVVPLALAGIIFPQAAQKKQRFNTDKLLALMRILFILNIFTAVLLYFIIPPLMPALFGVSFTDTALPLLILLPGVILFCFATLLAAYYAGHNKLLINLYGSIGCFVIILLLDLWLIPTRGATGAALASSIGYGITGLYYVGLYAQQQQLSIFQLLLPQKKDSSTVRALLHEIL
jgi:O-antigen/teichoic acid export membrane protein